MLGISLVFYKSNEAEYWRVDHLKNKQFAQKTFLVQKIIMHQFWWEAKLCTAFWKHLPKSIKKLKFTGKIGTIYDVITKTFCNECPFQVAISQLAVTCSKLAIETLKQRCEICWKLTIKPPKRRHLRRFDDFNVNFEHISHLCSTVSIVNFKQVNAGWAKYCVAVVLWIIKCTDCMSDICALCTAIKDQILKNFSKKIVLIHHSNIRFLAVKMFKVLKDINPQIVKGIFHFRDVVLYQLRRQTYAQIAASHSVFSDTISIKFSRSITWGNLPYEIQQLDRLTEFKKVKLLGIQLWETTSCPCRL